MRHERIAKEFFDDIFVIAHCELFQLHAVAMLHSV